MAQGLTSPVYLTAPPNDMERLFVVDQTGQIRLIKGGQLLPRPFLDVKDKIVTLKEEHEERGLLGMAFHPDFQSNGRFFVYYSAPLRKGAPAGWDHTSHIAEFRATPDAEAADIQSEKTILLIDEPQANHNGGMLAFGPDGYLYISLGDGGGANDNEKGHVPDWYPKNGGGNGQDTRNNLLGSILRIDVNSGIPYGIPADNPFADGRKGRKEIYAYGLRNPFRFAFDKETSMLIAADAGQELYEEIDVIKKGGNYGWNVKEGRHCFNASQNTQLFPDCPTQDSLGNPLIDPVLEFKNNKKGGVGLGIVSVGGEVYRGSGYQSLVGSYLFGVWTQHHEKPNGAIFAAEANADKSDWPYKKIFLKNRHRGELGEFLLGFGRDNAGAVYVLTNQKHGPVGTTGRVDRIK
ncbi:hypothetical protein EFA69_06315 [Rufibacter immobilis]|uniref:Glucose/Sorbosone dehydrogenase domain-containing protein n=2 Tax=Rufibacter immobilis TaxID=1348778 RepID=A0A3M9N1Z5_9BACT|nr:hypothetical protein EFA69_06315 [Rufibacter immobilis]